MIIIRRTLSSASDRRIEARYASTYTHQSLTYTANMCGIIVIIIIIIIMCCL